ncbi:MAG: TraY domain-containing protein [Sphingomonas sp.]
MATITVRNLDQTVYERLKQDAKANHRSLEAEARARLERPRMSAGEVVDRLRASQIDPGPGYEGSIALIRAIRDEE